MEATQAGAEVAKITANMKRSSSGYNGTAVADSQSSRQIHWSVRARTNAKHISN